MPRIASLASLTSATTFVTPATGATGLLAKDSSYGTAGAIATTTAFNNQAAIDIYWRRTSASEAAISVSGYISNPVSSITRYNVDDTTTTVTASGSTFLDLAIVPHSGSHLYKMVEVSEQTLIGTGSFVRQSTEFPAATFNALNNVTQFLAVGDTMGYRETLNASLTFQREYVVDFFIDNVLQYRFNLECHYQA
jgi:hypothetical protein